MKQIELKTNPGRWVAFFIFFFAFSSISLVYISDVNDLAVILGAAFAASAVIITILISIYNSYSQKVILSENEIRVFGIPSATISYNEIQKIRVTVGSFKIYGKSQTPILISNLSSNFREAKKLLIQNIRKEQNVVFEGSNRLIHKYFIE
ncbi:hypothetical protein [Rhodohalobacter sp.]|uniref:hypothetical protein n=1 Tax=Rhodohalobacter sp. TaxID=1974210 RepID=UPI002ACE789B|nr:hypothetical protein [Rhodohalobacter sp.]MDZ7757153.1 hypothetical protein [Rhodohalobacter sp.]